MLLLFQLLGRLNYLISVTGSSLKWTTRKTVKDLKWKKCSSCPMPLTIPNCKRAGEAFSTASKSRSNLLHSVRVNGIQHLFCVTNYVNGGSVIKHYETIDKHKQKLEKKHEFRKLSNILDIQVKKIDDEVCILTRSKNQVDIHRLSGSQLEYLNNDMVSSVELCSAVLWERMPGYWLQCSSTEEVRLYDCSRLDQKVLWSAATQKQATHERMHHWAVADFCYQNYAGVMATKSDVYKFDFRTKKLHQFLNILDVPAPFTMSPVCDIVPINGYPYVYIVTSDQVILYDERFSKVPILSWNTMLLNRPVRSVVKTWGDSAAIFLANNIEKKVSCVCIDGCTNDKQMSSGCAISSSSLTTQYEFINSMSDYAVKHDLWLYDEARVGLGYNFVGLDCYDISHSNKKKGEFSVLCSNANGDIFSQQFSFDDLDDAVLKMKNDEVYTRMKDWEDGALKNIDVCEDFSLMNVRSDVSERLNMVTNPKLMYRRKKRAVQTLANNEFNIAQTVGLTRASHQYRTSRSKRGSITWYDILLDNYIRKDVTGSKTGSSDDDSHSLKHFFPRASQDVIENFEDSDDLVASSVLRYWTLSPRENNNDLESLNAVPNNLEFYRAVPYTQKYQSTFEPPDKFIERQIPAPGESTDTQSVRTTTDCRSSSFGTRASEISGELDTSLNEIVSQLPTNQESLDELLSLHFPDAGNSLFSMGMDTDDPMDMISLSSTAPLPSFKSRSSKKRKRCDGF